MSAATLPGIPEGATVYAVTVRWSDMDAYAHVNNALFLRLMEDARIAALVRTLDLDNELGNTGALVARAEIDYLAPLAFRPHGVVIDVWAGRIGGASFELDYLIRDPDDLGDTVYARAATTMVWYDARTGATRRATPQERAGLERMEGEPLALGRSARGAGGAR